MFNVKKLVTTVLVGVLCAGAFVGCSQSGSTTSEGGKATKVYLITMDSQDQHWLSVKDGAEAMAKAIGNMELKFQAPDVKDGSKQIEYINNAVADKADAILLAATDPTNVATAVENAISAGVKVIYVDSPASVPAVATLSTNNYNAGVLAGKEMLANLEAKGVKTGQIGIVGVSNATNSTVNREQGFISAFEGTGFTILEPMYFNGDAAQSQDAAVNLINANDKVVGLFGSNEGSSTGIGNAIKDTGKKDSIVGIGFDKSNTIQGLIDSGDLKASMVQNPYTMGYLGVAQAYAAINGLQTGPEGIDTGVAIIKK